MPSLADGGPEPPWWEICSSRRGKKALIFFGVLAIPASLPHRLPIRGANVVRRGEFRPGLRKWRRGVMLDVRG